MDEVIKFETIKEAIKFLEEGKVIWVDFDIEVKGVGKYKVKVYIKRKPTM